MKTNYEIVNNELFNLKVSDVDTSGLKCNNYPSFRATGTLEIELASGEVKTWTGEFGSRDYLQEYGFILKIVE